MGTGAQQAAFYEGKSLFDLGKLFFLFGNGNI